MYYSLTFIIGGIKKNTWADWRLIPDTPPSIPPPEPNLNYVDIPTRIQLEEAITKYSPTMVFCEHESAFVRNIATVRVELK